MSPRVKYVPLYRGSREWRTTVATVDELACGALPGTAISEPFDMAAHESAAAPTVTALPAPISVAGDDALREDGPHGMGRRHPGEA